MSAMGIDTFYRGTRPRPLAAVVKKWQQDADQLDLSVTLLVPFKELTMKNRYLLAAVAAVGISALTPLEASAAACAAGVYRAGCVGPNGAVAVKKPPPPPARVVCGKGVYRAGCAGPNGAAVVRR